MKYLLLVLALAALAGCTDLQQATVQLNKQYPPSCKGHGKVILAQPIEVVISDQPFNQQVQERTRLTCEDGTVALTRD